MGLYGATLIGVGAIVGGGILALAGVAFQQAGPSALLAFALNGMIAVITALSFAEMATSFPQSGGMYTYAKRLFSIQAAFSVGWLVWFASIVAGVLYALGFAAFALLLLVGLWPGALEILGERGWQLLLAASAVGYYLFSLSRGSSGGSGQWVTVGKMVLFSFLILAGFPNLLTQPVSVTLETLQPFLVEGFSGVLAAMGFSFIAFQGFDLIAAVSGKIASPTRTIPRAMLLSLTLALGVYVPLLFMVITVGGDGSSSVHQLAAAHPETLIAVAVENYLGRTGYWIVVVAAVLSMLSALEANLLASSWIAYSMATDRALPSSLAQRHPQTHVPTRALPASAMMMLALVLVLPNVAVAGAAASLIFLLCFALIHWMVILKRTRGDGSEAAFKTPWFPLTPILGSLCCLGLAAFQGSIVPQAGGLAGIWLIGGAALYITLFERRARIHDAAAEGLDPSLMRYRGRSPVVLVPIANPDNAPAMVRLAHALSPPEIGRVLLLTVAPSIYRLEEAQKVTGQALRTAFEMEVFPEALTTVAAKPWLEIGRVFRSYCCQTLLLGLSSLEQLKTEKNLERLTEEVDSDVVILRAPEAWCLKDSTSILVPVGGRGGHDTLRARLLASLLRTYPALKITYLGIAALPDEHLHRNLGRIARDELEGKASTVVLADERPVAEVVAEKAQDFDLILLGLQRQGRATAFGQVSLDVAALSDKALLIIGRRS